MIHPELDKSEQLPEAKVPLFLTNLAKRYGFEKEMSELEALLAEARNTDNRGLFYFLLHTLGSLAYAAKTKGELKKSKPAVVKEEKEPDSSESEESGEKPEPSDSVKNVAMVKAVVVLLIQIAKRSSARVAKDPNDTWISPEEASQSVQSLRKLFGHVFGEVNLKTSSGRKQKHLEFGEKPRNPAILGFTTSVQGFVNEVIDGTLQVLPELHLFETASPDENMASQIMKTVSRELPNGVSDWSKIEDENSLDPSVVMSYAVNSVAKDLISLHKNIRHPVDKIASKLNLSAAAERTRSHNDTKITEEKLDQQLYILGYNIIHKVVEISGLLNVSARFNVTTQVSEVILNQLEKSTSKLGQQTTSQETENLITSVPAFKKMGFYDAEKLEAVRNEIKERTMELFSQDSLYEIATSIFKSMLDLESDRARIRTDRKDSGKPKKTKSGEADKYAMNANPDSEEEDFDTEEKIPGAYSTGIRDLKSDEKEDLKKGRIKEAEEEPAPETKSKGKPKQQKIEEALVMFKATLGIRPLMARILEKLGENESVVGTRGNVEDFDRIQTMYMDSLLYAITGTRNISEYAPGGSLQGGFRSILTDEIAKHWIYKLGLTFAAKLEWVKSPSAGVPSFYLAANTPRTRSKLVQESNREVIEAAVQLIEFYAHRKNIADKLPLEINNLIAGAKKDVVPRSAEIGNILLAFRELGAKYAQAMDKVEKEEAGNALVDFASRMFGSDSNGQLEQAAQALSRDMTKLRGMETFNAKAYENILHSFSSAVDDVEESAPENAKRALVTKVISKPVNAFATSVNKALEGSGIKSLAYDLFINHQRLNVAISSAEREFDNLGTPTRQSPAPVQEAKNPLAKISSEREKANLDQAKNQEIIRRHAELQVARNVNLLDEMARFALESAHINAALASLGMSNGIPTEVTRLLDGIAERTGKLEIKVLGTSETPAYELFRVLVQAITAISGEFKRTEAAQEKAEKLAEMKRNLKKILLGTGGKDWATQVIEATSKSEPAQRVQQIEAAVRGLVEKVSTSSLESFSSTSMEEPVAAEKELDPGENFESYVMNDLLDMDAQEDADEEKEFGPESKGEPDKEKQKASNKVTPKEVLEKSRGDREFFRNVKVELLNAMKMVLEQKKNVIEINNELMDAIIKTHPDLFPPDTRRDYKTGLKKIRFKGNSVTLWDLAVGLSNKVLLEVEKHIDKPEFAAAKEAASAVPVMPRKKSVRKD
jgi:hypothetical protein